MGVGSRVLDVASRLRKLLTRLAISGCTLARRRACLIRPRRRRWRAALVASRHRQARGRGHVRLLDHPRRSRCRRSKTWCGAWARKHLAGYTGMVNLETIGGSIIEAHLRFADQWPDLYGAGWVEALVRLYGAATGSLPTPTGVTAIASCCSGRTARVIAIRRLPWSTRSSSMPGVSSVQITFHEDTRAGASRHAARRLSPRHRQRFRSVRCAGRARAVEGVFSLARRKEAVVLARQRRAMSNEPRRSAFCEARGCGPRGPKAVDRSFAPRYSPGPAEPDGVDRGRKNHENRCVRGAGRRAARRRRGRSGDRLAGRRRQRADAISAMARAKQRRREAARRDRQARAGERAQAACRPDITAAGWPAGKNHLPRPELSRARQGRRAARQHSQISDDFHARPDFARGARRADHPPAASPRRSTTKPK